MKESDNLYTPRHGKKKKPLFYIPVNAWGWVEQGIQALFIIVFVAMVILVLIGGLR